MNLDRIQAFISGRHEQIEGWFFPLDQIIFYELINLQNQMRIEGDLCEIGVYQGKSLVFLSLLKSANDRLFGFDLFEGDSQSITQANLDAEGCSENVILRKGLTSDLPQVAIDSLIDKPLRFLHIDAGHEYHEVLEQLELFTPLVGDQGIIAMDDYQDREFPGIEAAVLDFAERDRPRRFVPFLAGANKMFLCFAPLVAVYQRAVLQQANFKDVCRLTRLRDFNVLISRSKLPVDSEKILVQISSSDFPKRAENELSLNQKSQKFSQIKFGSGQTDEDSN